MVFHVDKEAAIIIHITCTVFAWLILTPIVLYLTYTFYKSRHNEAHIAKRHPKLVIIINFSLIIDAIIVRPFSVYVDIAINTSYSDDNRQGLVTFDIKTISAMIAWTVLFTSLLLNVRLFSTYYDWTKSKHLLSAKWKSQTIFNQQNKIDNTSSTNHMQTPWTMTQLGRIIGNTKLLIAISLIWCVIAEICVMYVNIIYQSHNITRNLSLFVFYLGLLIIIRNII